MAAMTMKHKFLIFAFLLILIGAWSANSAQGALNQAPTTYPTRLAATAVSPTQIDLSWTAPTQNYGKTIVGYKIEQEVGYGVYNTLVYNSGSTLTAYSVTGLKTGVTYTYRVSAVYSDDTSTSPSNPAGDTPTSTSTAPITSVSPSAPKNTKFDFVPSDGTALAGVIVSSDDYIALQYKKDARSMLLDPVQTTNPINNNISNLLAYQNNHLSPDSVPAPLIAKAISDTKILLTWLPPLEQYGQQLVGYKIELKNAPGDYQSVDDNTGNGDTKYYVTGLEPGKTYTYRVFVVYPGTHSNPSNEATTTTLVPAQPHVSKPNQTTTPQSNTLQSVPPPTVNNVQLDFTAPDGTLLSGVIMTQSDYQQLVVIKDPRTILSNVSQTSSQINNDLAGLIRYQNLHPLQPTSTSPPPVINSSEQPQPGTLQPSVPAPADSKLVDSIVTSVVASGVVGIITWFVKTKVARKIAKDYHFTLEHVSSDTPQIRIRNSGETIEDCVILCDRDACVWADTHLNKPRHVYEGSVSVATIPQEYEHKNPVISIKSRKKILKKIKLDEMAHG
jgi:hypothetical protein